VPTDLASAISPAGAGTRTPEKVSPERPAETIGPAFTHNAAFNSACRRAEFTGYRNDSRYR
jgi:hypothetical protein